MSRWLDRRAARRWFERAAAGAGDDPVAREVERRMASRLEYVKLAPRRILDVGCGVARGAALLRSRYPRAKIVLADSALELVRSGRRAQPITVRARSAFGAAPVDFLCADMSALPFATGAFGMLWSNLVLAWADDLAAAFAEWHRVLEVGGLLMFSSYGPDTLKELRTAFAAAGPGPHVHPFVDLHDLGDALVAIGFSDPVMDMEMLTVTYDRAAALFADLRATGQRNALLARPRGLTGRHAWERMVASYAALARDGRVPATFEIVYGHAWKAAPRVTADGRAIIRFDRPRRTG